MKKLALLPLILLAGCGGASSSPKQSLSPGEHVVDKNAERKLNADPNYACKAHSGVRGTAPADTSYEGAIWSIGVTCMDGYYTTVDSPLALESE